MTGPNDKTPAAHDHRQRAVAAASASGRPANVIGPKIYIWRVSRGLAT